MHSLLGVAASGDIDFLCLTDIRMQFGSLSLWRVTGRDTFFWKRFMLPVWYNDPQSLNCPLWHHLLYMDSFKCVHYFAFGTSYACWHWFSPRTDVIGSTLRFAEKVDVYIIVPVVCAVCRRCTVEVKTVTF